MNQYLDNLDELENDETLDFPSLSDLDDDEEEEEEEFKVYAPLYMQDTANVGMIST